MNLLKENVSKLKRGLHEIQQDEQKQTTEDHQINQMLLEHKVSTVRPATTLILVPEKYFVMKNPVI